MSKACFGLSLLIISTLVIDYPAHADMKSGYIDSSGHIINGQQDTQDYVRTHKTPRLPEGSMTIGRPEKFSVFKSSEGFGVVDESGNVVIKPARDFIFPVGDDLFVRQQQGAQNRFLLIDVDGKELAVFDHRAQLQGKKFSEGFITVSHGFGNSMNYCDKNGKPLSDQMYISGGAFSEGLANVLIDSREQSGGGYIDHQGKFVIGPLPKASCSPFEDGFALIDYPTITPEGSWAHKCGAIDKTGKFIIPAKYDELSRFSKAFFLAKLDNRFELVDSSNKRIMQFPVGCKEILSTRSSSMSQLIPCSFAMTRNSTNANEEPDSPLWGFSDMKGNLAIAAKFFRCEPFENGSAIVSIRKDGQTLVGLIDESGNWKIEPIYQSLDRLASGHFQYAREEKSKDANEPEVTEASHRAGNYGTFSDLLKAHNVIGMTVEELQKYLGDPIKSDSNTMPDAELLPISIKSMISYDASVAGAHCGNGYAAIELGFDKSGKVWGWRLNAAQSHGHWYTENVVFDDAHNGVQLPRPKI